MKDWVEAQAQTGRYSNASDYVRDLIRRDQDIIDLYLQGCAYPSQNIAGGIALRS